VSHPHVDLAERVAALRMWCEERIHGCRITEAALPDTLVARESAEVRHMLAEVLTRLGYPVPPRQEGEGTR
jgi:hypothetical protein